MSIPCSLFNIWKKSLTLLVLIAFLVGNIFINTSQVFAQSSSPSPSPVPMNTPVPQNCAGKNRFDPSKAILTGLDANIGIQSFSVNATPRVVRVGDDPNKTFPYATGFRVHLAEGQKVRILATEVSLDTQYTGAARIFIYTSERVMQSSTTSITFVAPSENDYTIIIDDEYCDQSDIRFSMYETDQLELSAYVEYLDGERTPLFDRPVNTYTQVRSDPVQFLIRAPMLDTISINGDAFTYKLRRDDGSIQTYTHHLKVYQRAVPAVTPGSPGWFFFPEDPPQAPSIQNISAVKEGNYLRVGLSPPDCCSRAATFFKSNMQYMVLLTEDDGQTRWRAGFTTVDPGSIGGSCQADFNRDNRVDLLDFSAFIRNFLKPIAECHI